MQTEKGGTENLIERFSLVVVRIYPSRAGRFLSTDVSLVEIIPVPAERIFVKEKATLVYPRVSLLLQFTE